MAQTHITVNVTAGASYITGDSRPDPTRKSFRQTVEPYTDLFDREKKIESFILSRLTEGTQTRLYGLLNCVQLCEDYSKIPITAESVVQNIIWGMVDRGLLRCDKDSWLSLATSSQIG